MLTPTANSHLPSHSNELTPVGMQNMVCIEIATDETQSLPHSKCPKNTPHINVSSYEGKNNKRSSWHLKQWKVNAADMYLTFSRSTLMEKEIMKAGTRANVSLYPNLVICQIQTSGEE